MALKTMAHLDQSNQSLNAMINTGKGQKFHIDMQWILRGPYMLYCPAYDSDHLACNQEHLSDWVRAAAEPDLVPPL